MKEQQTISQWCEENGVNILARHEPLLKNLQTVFDPPSQLFVRGDLSALERPCLAIVGARNASAYGIRSALFFAKELALQGFCIVSGLARGVDAAAHRGALMAKGKTVAVLGHGLDRIYPVQNLPLAREIVALGGCLASEYAPFIPPYPAHFPARNRIIAGLSVGVLVIEAREKSGSLITAKLALESGRDVFIVPGLFDAPGFMGSHRLIQEGAKPVVTIEDILSELGFAVLPRVEPQREMSVLEKCFYDVEGMLTLEEIFLRTTLTLEQLNDTVQTSIEKGEIVEVFPQTYSWLGRSGV